MLLSGSKAGQLSVILSVVTIGLSVKGLWYIHIYIYINVLHAT